MLYAEPMPFKDALATKRRKLDRERTAARIERELSQVLAVLREKGTARTGEIARATCLTPSCARARLKQLGGKVARDAIIGRWKMANHILNCSRS
jgi:hypothetical protein